MCQASILPENEVYINEVKITLLFLKKSIAECPHVNCWLTSLTQRIREYIELIGVVRLMLLAVNGVNGACHSTWLSSLA